LYSAVTTNSPACRSDYLRLLQVPGLDRETRLAKSRPEVVEFDAEVCDERRLPEAAAQ
jgi:hypothetical protein